MPAWHDENPWRKRHRKPPAETLEGRLDEIEERCRAGDISLRQAIDAAASVGKAYGQAGMEPAATAKE